MNNLWKYQDKSSSVPDLSTILSSPPASSSTKRIHFIPDWNAVSPDLKIPLLHRSKVPSL